MGIFDNRIVNHSATLDPLNKPVKMPMLVMPIWMVDRNLSGFSASCRARSARLSPFLASVSNRTFFMEIKAISERAKAPFSKMSPKIINASIY